MKRKGKKRAVSPEKIRGKRVKRSSIEVSSSKADHGRKASLVPLSKRRISKGQLEGWMEIATDHLRSLRMEFSALTKAVREQDPLEPEMISPEKLMTDCKPYKKSFGCTDFLCYSCKVEQRNACWKEIRKDKRRKEIAGGLPYSEYQLREMSRPDLSCLAGILNINTFKLEDKSTDNLITNILLKQSAVEKMFQGGADNVKVAKA